MLPFFPEKVNNVTVKVGQSAELRCKVDNLNSYKVRTNSSAGSVSRGCVNASPLGCVGPRRHADDPEHPQQRDHAQPAHLAVPSVRRPVVHSHPEGQGERPRLVHVPDQHRPHGAQIRIPGSRWYAFLLT